MYYCIHNSESKQLQDEDDELGARQLLNIATRPLEKVYEYIPSGARNEVLMLDNKI